MNSSISISEFFRALLGALVAAAVLVVVLEITLRVLPIVSGVHRQSPRSGAASARLVANHDYTWSMGWDLRHVVKGKTNAMGFIAPYDYSAETPAIALLGDSFVEAQMLAYDESLAGRLDARLGGGMRAFNFGLSGAALPHYLGMAREMGSHYRFAAAVVVVTGMDYEEGFELKEGLYRWSADPQRELISLVPAVERGSVVSVAREMALVRYVRANLKLSAGKVFARHGEASCEPRRLSATDHKRLTDYVEQLPAALRLEPGRIVMVFNSGSNTALYERVDRGRVRHAACPTLDSLALAELRRLAGGSGMKVIEVDQLLEAHYRAHRQALDFKPVDSHWNGTATAVVAAEIVRVLGPRSVHAAAGAP
jgi:hypothetical protein